MAEGHQQTIKWLPTNGWLVLSGYNTEVSSIRAQVLERSVEGEGIAYISSRLDQGDALMEDMEDLGAPSGFLIDLANDSPQDVEQLLAHASIVMIESDDDIDELYYGLLGKFASILKDVLLNQTVVMVEGRAASLFGRWFVSDDGQLLDGLNWVQQMFVLPTETSESETELVSALLQAKPAGAVIRVGLDSAIAFGSAALEIWGQQDVGFVLGQEYHVS